MGKLVSSSSPADSVNLPPPAVFQMYGASAHGLHSNFVPRRANRPHPTCWRTGSVLQLRAKPRSEPIVPVELSEVPIRWLRKCTRTHNPSAPSLQPGKAPKRAKKGGERELNLDWELVAGGNMLLIYCLIVTRLLCLNRDCFSRVQLSKSERKIGVEDGYTVSTPRMTKINSTDEYQKQH
ncbi:hypothetical protein B0H14DRAFT_3154506 [Mycena olivaceomarginata]|nr:hypothetical protein B0H14DRAFT_3154506 [Mycena olivaceomarginata]